MKAQVIAKTQTQQGLVDNQTRPEQYKHWKYQVQGAVATLAMAVQEDGGLRSGEYELKLNSYDLSVDIELADAVQRLRFEHPEVSVVVVTSAMERIFCAGANIFMLNSSTHPFKVNFCKYTNETRLAMEEASEESGQTYLAALNGVTSGGGYELALACKEIHLIDDRSSAVSLPEIPYLGVLPGTGGLTRLVDKRYVRRDLADVFSTLAEGIKGKRATDWRLVDAVHPPSQWEAAIHDRAQELTTPPKATKGVVLEPLEKECVENEIRYRHLTLALDSARRVATLTLRAPESLEAIPEDPSDLGCRWYPLEFFRALDDALVELRFNHEEIGVVEVHSEGALSQMMALDAQLQEHQSNWFVKEVLLLIRRTLKRMDMTARSFFTLVEKGSCFGGLFFEIALASDRIYMLNDPDAPPTIQLSALNGGMFPMGNGLGRLEQRFLNDPDHFAGLKIETNPTFSPEDALAAGLVTSAPDDLDWDDEVRLAIEERATLSPDALTGMEASLRFGGPETMETKIFGRLSAWQNWIFQRPNATGEQGALTLYGQPGSREFDKRRT